VFLKSHIAACVRNCIAVFHLFVSDVNILQTGRRSHGSEPAGRGVRQRTPAARQHPAADRGAGAPRRAPVRHLAPTARLSWLRLQDPRQVRLLCATLFLTKDQYLSCS